MNSCLHEDSLLTIGQALEWEVDEGLRHLHDCERCKKMLEDLSGLNRLLKGQEPIDPKIMDRVTGALEREMAAEKMANQPLASPVAERWIRFLASATIAFVIMMVAAALRGEGATAIWTAALLALLAGAAAGVIGDRGQRYSSAAHA